MNPPRIEVDGLIDFSGGMDSSTDPSRLQVNQYVYAVNCQLKDSRIGISTRPGYREIKLVFEDEGDEETYRTGRIQGDGYYYNGVAIILLACVDGLLFEFTPLTEFVYSVKRIKNYRNNPKIRNIYISTVPFGAIINDGESAPFYAYRGGYQRVRGKTEIGPGLMGVYLQNRFFYVRPNQTEIYASELNNPTSLREAINANIYGFRLPEDDGIITAIGHQKTLNKTATGGNLAFASNKNIYAVDARGPRSQWGTPNGDGIGFVDKSVPDFGATSGYSFEPVNGNIFFRNPRMGLVSLQSLQYQFVNQDITENAAFGASRFFDDEHVRFLDSCYTKAYKKRVYTTIAPELSRGGGIFWNGLIVAYPQSGNNSIRFDSIFTGIRPWTVCVTRDNFGFERMFIHSFDHDEVNRLYILDDSIDYDIVDGKRVEIESQLLTRCFNFKNPLSRKRTNGQFYSLGEISRDVNVNIKSRTSDIGQFNQVWDFKHLVKPCCFKGACWLNANISKQEREVVTVADSLKGEFHFRQDLFKIKGPFSLKQWVRQAMLDLAQQSVTTPERTAEVKTYEPERIFSYRLK